MPFISVSEAARESPDSCVLAALGQISEYPGTAPGASPAAVLEMEYLFEIGRLHRSAEKIVAILESSVGLRVCSMPFRDVAMEALQEKWTRDPFDRLIVANAKAAGAPLVTKDERIRKHYRRAIW